MIYCDSEQNTAAVGFFGLQEETNATIIEVNICKQTEHKSHMFGAVSNKYLRYIIPHQAFANTINFTRFFVTDDL